MMDKFDWLVEMVPMEVVWSFATKGFMELFVEMVFGAPLMLRLCVDNSDTQQEVNYVC